MTRSGAGFSLAPFIHLYVFARVMLIGTEDKSMLQQPELTTAPHIPQKSLSSSLLALLSASGSSLRSPCFSGQEAAVPHHTSPKPRVVCFSVFPCLLDCAWGGFGGGGGGRLEGGLWAFGFSSLPGAALGGRLCLREWVPSVHRGLPMPGVQPPLG